MQWSNPVHLTKYYSECKSPRRLPSGSLSQASSLRPLFILLPGWTRRCYSVLVYKLLDNTGKGGGGGKGGREWGRWRRKGELITKHQSWIINHYARVEAIAFDSSLFCLLAGMCCIIGVSFLSVSCSADTPVVETAFRETQGHRWIQ